MENNNYKFKTLIVCKRDYSYDSLFKLTYLKVLILFAHLRVLLYKNHIRDYAISDCCDRKSSSVEDYIK